MDPSNNPPQDSGAPYYQGPPQNQYQNTNMYPAPNQPSYQYPQQQYQQGQPMVYGNQPAGYLPPNQYGAGVSAEEAALQNKQRDLTIQINAIDKRLSSGGYQCFYVWMWISLVLQVLSVFSGLNSDSADSDSTDSSNVTFNPTAIALGTCWVLLQNVAEIIAIKKKNLLFSTIGALCFAINTVVLIGVEIWLITLDVALSNDTTDDQAAIDIVEMILSIYMTAVGIMLFLQFITLYASVKVWKYLKERSSLQQQLNSESIVNRVN